MGRIPAIFATALETLSVKAFGDMGQTARLRLIRDRFIAGHSSCELRRHLDSVPPETPITDVVDRFRIWESPVGSRVMQQHSARTWTSRFRLCSQDGGRRNSGGIYYDPTPGGDGPSVGGKRRLIRVEGLASRVSGHVRPRDPGGGGQCRLFPMTDDN